MTEVLTLRGCGVTFVLINLSGTLTYYKLEELRFIFFCRGAAVIAGVVSASLPGDSDSVSRHLINRHL